MTVKLERINKNVQRELSYIISNEVKNPHIKYVSITDCEVSSDLSYAKVYVTTLKDEKETMLALKSAKGFIRKELANRIELRHIPELEFVYDKSIEYGLNIENKIKEINSEK